MSKKNSSKIRCEECNEELTQKKFVRHIQSLKHKKMSEYMIEKNIESAKRVGRKLLLKCRTKVS